MAGLVPAIHVWLQNKSWMPGHQGVYAHLRRAMAGHDGILVDAFELYFAYVLARILITIIPGPTVTLIIASGLFLIGRGVGSRSRAHDEYCRLP